MTELILVLVALSSVFSIIGLFLLIQSKSIQEKIAAEVMSKVSQTSSDFRQDLTDRINDRMLQVSKELRDGLRQIGSEVQVKLDKNLRDGFTQFEKIQQSLFNAEKQLLNLNTVGESIHELNNVLNLPHLRGKIIGEGSLERLLADFLPSDFFGIQYNIDGAIVDAVIKYPQLNLVLPIDSKFNMEQVSALFESSANPDHLKTARKKLAEIVKQNAKEIKTKYIKPKNGTTDYAMMYLPSETLYFEVIRDTDLWGSLVAQKVFPVSPNTLAITVHSIGKSLHYYEMAKGVQKTIQQIQTAQSHLADFRKRFEDIGDKLSRAQESFMKANTHLSNYSASLGRFASPEDLATPSATPSSKEEPSALLNQ